MRQLPKLIAMDIDFTIVDSEKNMHPLTRECLIKLHKAGVQLGIASGRPIRAQLEFKHKIWNLPFQFDFIIGMNGGQLWSQKEKVVEEFYKLDGETVKEIIEMMSPLDENFFVYGPNGEMLVKRIDEATIIAAKRNKEEIKIIEDINEIYGKSHNKVLFRIDDVKRLKSAKDWADSHQSDKYNCFQTGPRMLEFQDSRISKGKTLEKYCTVNHIELSNVVAFGDTTNDNEMLQIAGTGVCLSNGSDDTKKIADEITEYSCEEDGVGKWMMQNFFSDNS